MNISGHRTQSIFDRNNIVSGADLASALERRDQYLDTGPVERKVTPFAKAR